MAQITVKDGAGADQTVAKVVNTGSTADADSMPVTQSTEDKAVQTAIAAVAGATSGAAVTTDANGTLQQYLRGIITKFISGIVVFGAAAENAPVAGNPNLVGGRYDTSDRTLGNGDTGAIALDVAGRVKVVGDANLAAAATGGYTPGFVISTASINASSLKGSAGTLGFVTCLNPTATIAYAKFFDVAGTPDPSADAASCKLIFPIPANTAGAGVAVPIPPQGLLFATGLGIVITGALAAADETNAVAGAVANYGFK